jgi:hypothetical protein
MVNGGLILGTVLYKNLCSSIMSKKAVFFHPTVPYYYVSKSVSVIRLK